MILTLVCFVSIVHLYIRGMSFWIKNMNRKVN